MTAVVRPDDFDEWLAPDTPEKRLPALARCAYEGPCDRWPVSRRVNSPRNEGPDLAQPLDGQAPGNGCAAGLNEGGGDGETRTSGGLRACTAGTDCGDDESARVLDAYAGTATITADLANGTCGNSRAQSLSSPPR